MQLRKKNMRLSLSGYKISGYVTYEYVTAYRFYFLPSSCWAPGMTRRICWLYWSYLFEGLCCALSPLVYSFVRWMLEGVWLICLPGLGVHQLFIVPGHRKQCKDRSFARPHQSLLYTPVSGLGGGRREMKNHLRYSHTFPTNRPDRESNPGRLCDRPECYH